MAVYNLAFFAGIGMIGVALGAAVALGSGPIWAAYTGVVTAGLPYLLFSLALRHITPATGVTLALCEPVVAFALSVSVLEERPAASAYVGLFLVVVGVLGVVRQELAGPRLARGRGSGAVQSVT